MIVKIQSHRSIKNPLARQPFIAQGATGKNPSNVPSATNVRAVRNYQAAPFAAAILRGK